MKDQAIDVKNFVATTILKPYCIIKEGREEKIMKNCSSLLRCLLAIAGKLRCLFELLE